MSQTVFRIELLLGNDAMKTTGDIRRKLAEFTKKKLDSIADSGESKKILDDNGNAVGRVGFYLE